MGIFRDLKYYLSELTEGVQEVQTNMVRVQDEVEHTQKVGEDIQQKVSEFQFSIQGNIDVIGHTFDKYQKPSEHQS